MSGSRCILLVDDNRLEVDLTLDALREIRSSSRAEVAGDGQTALDYIFGDGPYADRERHPLPDLVLLDLKMPGIDGFEVLKRIKETPLLRRIPVIVLTSSHERNDRALAYECGANSYIVKPVSFDKFVEIVAKIEDYWLLVNAAQPR